MSFSDFYFGSLLNFWTGNNSAAPCAPDWHDLSRQFLGTCLLSCGVSLTYNAELSKAARTMSVIGEDRVRGAVFKDINAEEEDAQPTEIESLCMNCYENVSDQMTALTITLITVWRFFFILDVIGGCPDDVSLFCPKCPRTCTLCGTVLSCNVTRVQLCVSVLACSTRVLKATLSGFTTYCIYIWLKWQWSSLGFFLSPGEDASSPHQDPLLQGNHHQFLHMFPLSLDQHRDPVCRPDPRAGSLLHTPHKD